jgi:hypothetical protein
MVKLWAKRRNGNMLSHGTEYSVPSLAFITVSHRYTSCPYVVGQSSWANSVPLRLEVLLYITCTSSV